MGQVGRIQFKDGSIATLDNKTWKCDNKLREIWLNLRFGRWMKVADYLPTTIHRLNPVAKAFDAEIIEMPEEPDYPAYTVF